MTAPETETVTEQAESQDGAASGETTTDAAASGAEASDATDSAFSVRFTSSLRLTDRTKDGPPVADAGSHNPRWKEKGAVRLL